MQRETGFLPKLAIALTIACPMAVLGQTAPHPDTAPAAAQTCAACHGAQGQGADEIPRLAGQPAGYLREQLQRFRDGSRENTSMQAVAKALSAADVRTLAAWFSGLQPAFTAAPNSLSATARARAHKLVTVGDWPHGVPGCARCHGPDLDGVAPDIPALTGQPAQYLSKRLDDFRVVRNPGLTATLMHRISSGLSAADRQAVTAYIAQLKPGEMPESKRPLPIAYPATPQSPQDFSPPPESAIPMGADGDMIWKGRQIFEFTRKYASQNVGNALNCSSSHLDRGRRAGSAPMWAAYVTYPRYRSKSHKVNTLIERIQDCFRFSMNGKSPAADSDTMVALVKYFHWLATGLPVGIVPKGAGYPDLPKPPEPDSSKRGAGVYSENCALCHGADGQGRQSRNTQVFPPLWGPRSYNRGAGMSRVQTAADFIQANMPYGAGGTLTLQQAWDVAAYVDSHSRPKDPQHQPR